MKISKAVSALDALSQESRLLIFRLLMEQGEAGLSAGNISEQLSIPPATLSFHLSQLSSARLLDSHKEGRSVIYKANYKRIRKLAKFLTSRIPITEEDQPPLL
jgi:DNA-binding transcriptional ArsR family regulator